jgi:hypothetical protein
MLGIGGTSPVPEEQDLVPVLKCLYELLAICIILSVVIL